MNGKKKNVIPKIRNNVLKSFIITCLLFYVDVEVEE